jgi:hypothetical protein
MGDLSNDERNLLRRYSKRDRVINTHDTTPAHQHLLGFGHIKEHAANIQYLRISVTEAGRQALRTPSYGPQALRSKSGSSAILAAHTISGRSQWSPKRG